MRPIARAIQGALRTFGLDQGVKSTVRHAVADGSEAPNVRFVAVRWNRREGAVLWRQSQFSQARQI